MMKLSFNVLNIHLAIFPTNIVISIGVVVQCQMITRNLESSDYDDVEVLDLDDAGDEAEEDEELQEEQEKGYDPIEICDQPSLTPEQQEACQNKHWKQTDHF